MPASRPASGSAGSRPAIDVHDLDKTYPGDIHALRGLTFSMEPGTVFALLAISYWFVQIARGEHYYTLSENNRIRSVRTMAPRGYVLDRHGSILVDNQPGYTLYLYRREAKNLEASVDFAAGVLKLPRDQVRARVGVVPVAAGLSQSAMRAVISASTTRWPTCSRLSTLTTRSKARSTSCLRSRRATLIRCYRR